MPQFQSKYQIDMTDQEINIAIAEACGWVSIRYTGPLEGLRGVSPNDNKLHNIHDYTTDLNAMHEAEKTLSVMWNKTKDGCEANAYIRILHEVVGGVPNCFNHHCATARHRAEAFLRTIGKWKE